MQLRICQCPFSLRDVAFDEAGRAPFFVSFEAMRPPARPIIRFPTYLQHEATSEPCGLQLRPEAPVEPSTEVNQGLSRVDMAVSDFADNYRVVRMVEQVGNYAVQIDGNAM